jgi:CheY-like chemotaxis protein
MGAHFVTRGLSERTHGVIMNGSRQLILVVDDDADVREAVSVFLQSVGYQTAPAANGRQAIDWLLAQEAPGLILLDLTMPVMDGYQFLTGKEAYPALLVVPVVVMTAVPDCWQLLHRHQVSQCVSKPLWPSALLDAVEHSVRVHR